MEKQVPLRSEAAALWEMIATERDGQDWVAILRGESWDLQRLEVEVEFVDQNDRPSFMPGFF